VTVIDELAVRADGISTALMVLGPDQGFALAERLGLPVLFIVRDEGGGFTERATPRFDAITTH
jgi:thiamine biosynthesis lipoprotein